MDNMDAVQYDENSDAMETSTGRTRDVIVEAASKREKAYRVH